MVLPLAPPASSEAVRRVLQRNGRRDTAPELSLRRELHALGLRFPVDATPAGTSIVARDADTDRQLREAGWLPVVVWEHEDMSEAARRIADLHAVRRNVILGTPDLPRQGLSPDTVDRR